jgi:hypothetical protein
MEEKLKDLKEASDAELSDIIDFEAFQDDDGKTKKTQADWDDEQEILEEEMEHDAELTPGFAYSDKLEAHRVILAMLENLDCEYYIKDIMQILHDEMTIAELVNCNR